MLLPCLMRTSDLLPIEAVWPGGALVSAAGEAAAREAGVERSRRMVTRFVEFRAASRRAVGQLQLLANLRRARTAD
jgi:hypothetical protein